MGWVTRGHDASDGGAGHGGDGNGAGATKTGNVNGALRVVSRSRRDACV